MRSQKIGKKGDKKKIRRTVNPKRALGFLRILLSMVAI